MDAAASPPRSRGRGRGVLTLGIFFSFSFPPFSTNFSLPFIILYRVDESFYLKITFIQRVILPTYGVIILSTFDLFKQLLIIRNVQLHFWQKLFFFIISIVLSSRTLLLSTQHVR